MDICRNVSVSGGFPADIQPEQQQGLPPSSCSKLGSLDDLFYGHTMEEGDVNMEWLSIFVEDCLSSGGNCLPPTLAVVPSNPQGTTSIATTTHTVPDPKTSKPLTSLPLHKFVVPGKARSKRKRSPMLTKSTSCWSKKYQGYQNMNSDPPLLQQAHWLADSELILPKKDEGTSGSSIGEIIGGERKYFEEEMEEEEKGSYGQGQGHQGGQGRRCTHCLSQRTPQWRAGPLGPKTLCNACGVRYTSGRLLPEYRPAKSPTFVSYKHSNSHKKVLEMRMTLLSSPNSSSS